MKQNRNYVRYGTSALIALAVVGGVTYSVSAWTAPGSTPPNGNVTGPVTTGSTAQTKNGDLTIGSGYKFTASRYCMGASDCITAWPSAGENIWTKNGSNIYYNSGNVGIGLTNPGFPLHIKSAYGSLEFAGSYSGALGNWPNYVGMVVKKPGTSQGTAEAVVGVGGQGGEAPGFSATNNSGRVDMFLQNTLGGLIFQSCDKSCSTVRPSLLITSKLGVGYPWDYGYGEKPLATLHVKGDVLATSKVTTPQYCIGTSCITAWSQAGGGGTLDLRAVTTKGATSDRHMYINNTSPTLALQDTNHKSAFLTADYDTFYVNRGDINGTTPDSFRPFMVNLNNGDVTIANTLTAKCANINGTYYGSCSSDERLKEDIEVIPNALARLMNIRGVSYTWKDTGKRDNGVIAQDMQKSFPEAVRKDSEGNLSVDYGILTPILIESVKEQQAQIEEQQAQIEEQRRINESLEDRIKLLEEKLAK